MPGQFWPGYFKKEDNVEPLLMTKRNFILVDERIKYFKTLAGPRVGDFVDMLDGSRRRFTYDWGDSIQVTAHPDSGYSESFYLGSHGADYSGALAPSIPKKNLENTGLKHEGKFWVFDEAMPGAGRGRWIAVVCDVWKQTNA